MLSHLGNLSKPKAREPKAVGVERIVSPMFIHSYHNGHQHDTTGVDELGYSFNSLTLSASDVTEMKRAYLADESVHLGVPIATIYRIIALGETLGFDGTLVKKVQAWKDTAFFVHTLPNTDAPILYTLASMQVLMWPNADEDRPDLTKMLVTVMPSMSMVRLTTMDTITAQDEMEEGHYMTHDLRFDAMLLSHNCAQHCSLAQTLRNAAAIGWWSEVKVDIAWFYNSCSLCLPRRKAHRTTEIGVMAAQRFKALPMDFKIRDGDIALASGFPAILTIIRQGPSGPVFRARTGGALGTTWHTRSQYQNQVHQEGQ